MQETKRGEREVERKKQRKYHARDRTRKLQEEKSQKNRDEELHPRNQDTGKYQKKLNKRKYVNKLRQESFSGKNKEQEREDRWEQKNEQNNEQKTYRRRERIPKEEGTSRKARIKKRTTYSFAKKLRQEEITHKNQQRKTQEAVKDEAVGSEKPDAVILGRKAIYKRRRYKDAFYDHSDYKADRKNGTRKPETRDTGSRLRQEPLNNQKTDNSIKQSKKQRNKTIQKKRYKTSYAKSYGKNKHKLITLPWNKAEQVLSNDSNGDGAFVVVRTVLNNKGKIAIAIILLVIVLAVVSVVFVLVSLFMGLTSVLTTTTYPSTDEDIEATEKAYTELEDALNTQINSMEATHPGYDEYRYQVDEIAHNPYELISYFTVKYGDFTFEDIEDEIRELFDRQYILRVWETIEKRTRRVTKIGLRTATDPNTGQATLEPYTYEEDEEYDYKILNISLTNRGIRAIAVEDFTTKDLELFDTYTALHGNRDGIFQNTYIPTTDVDHYKIPPEALSDEGFRRMATEAEKYLGYPYVWGGSNPSTSFDCSGFVCYVLNNCGNGWNVGRTTAEGLRHITTYVSPQDARPGDIIYFQGTYNTAGASHVGIYVGDGMMIHCGNPIQYASINTPYWQQHFFEFGRMQ